jgi:hypothetical protein
MQCVVWDSDSHLCRHSGFYAILPDDGCYTIFSDKYPEDACEAGQYAYCMEHGCWSCVFGEENMKASDCGRRIIAKGRFICSEYQYDRS